MRVLASTWKGTDRRERPRIRTGRFDRRQTMQEAYATDERAMLCVPHGVTTACGPSLRRRSCMPGKMHTVPCGDGSGGPHSGQWTDGRSYCKIVRMAETSQPFDPEAAASVGITRLDYGLTSATPLEIMSRPILHYGRDRVLSNGAAAPCAGQIGVRPVGWGRAAYHCGRCSRR